MVRTDILGQTVPAYGTLKHPAQCHSVNRSAVDAEPDDAPSELVHNHENPMSSQRSRFAAEQIAAPQTVPGMTENVSQDGPPEPDSGR